jgi:GNAT superfamily N-acetyltransferase
MMNGDATSEFIFQAAPEDVPPILPLFDAYRKFFAGRTDAGESQRFLHERFMNRDSVIFAAKRANETIGFTQLYPLWSSWYCRRIWFLSDLYVAESARGRGVGRRLIERTIEYARDTNAMSILVELPRREPHLTEFYARLGFERDDVFDIARYRVG